MNIEKEDILIKMNKKQALKVKKLIEMWVRKHKLWKLSKEVKVRIQESKYEKNWYGVYISTDSYWYDYLYNNGGDLIEELAANDYGLPSGYTLGFQSDLEKHILKRMKWKRNDHYFDSEGMGVLYMY